MAKAKIIDFTTRQIADEEELPVGLPPPSAVREPPALVTSVIDLTGRPKVWFVIGPGRSGKTMLVRWAVETCLANGAPLPIIAAADPQNRSLAHYMEVHQPPSNDALGTARWTESLLRYVSKKKTSAMVDFGGGDTSLQRLLTEVPTLADELEAQGVAPVAIYMLGPRVDDLSSLATFEALGFQPKATALVCNEGLLTAGAGRDAFYRVRHHTAYLKALERGAVPLWMPALTSDEAVREIETKRLGFFQARDALSPPGRTVEPLAPFDRSRVRTWLQLMAGEMLPVLSWLP